MDNFKNRGIICYKKSIFILVKDSMKSDIISDPFHELIRNSDK